jgi:PTH1 family peptidyl-tRNA hydrolase
MKLVVGLGNPGPKYSFNRHNIGFMALDAFAQGFGPASLSWKNEHKALTLKFAVEKEQVLLCKPQTFMNLSGESVAPLLNYYNLSLDDLIVLHDEVDLPFGRMKFQRRRSPGGNNGIKSIHHLLGTDDYVRLRLGVGRPPHPKMSMADWVLQDFSKEEMEWMPEYLEMIMDGLKSFLGSGYEKAATAFNNRALINEEE